MLPSYSMIPCEGHLDGALHVFSYQKSKSNLRLVCDLMEPDVGKSNFVECEWSNFYQGVEEVLPPSAPEPLGKGVIL